MGSKTILAKGGKPRDLAKRRIVDSFKKGEGRELSSYKAAEELSRRYFPMRFHRTSLVRWGWDKGVIHTRPLDS